MTMTTTMLRGILFAFLLALAAAHAAAGEFEIGICVTEPAGVERRAFPASGGVVFKPGQVKDVAELALFNKSGTPVPAQFTKLAGYGDGSVQWALVDTLTDLPADGRADLTVKPGKVAAPTTPLKTSEAGDLITVDAGAARFTVNKENFHLLESVEMGGKSIAGPGALDVKDVSGKTFKAGKPDKIAWEYRGPLRSTLRVDGSYLDGDGKRFLFYTVRLTFWAGLSTVRVEHSLRNSDPEKGSDAGIKDASLGLALSFKGVDQGKDAHWAACGDGQHGVLVSFRHSGGLFPGGRDLNARLPKKSADEANRIEVGGERATVWAVPEGGTRYGYGDGRFNLMDCAHKDTEVWFDFYTGTRDAVANGRRQVALRSRLHALTDGAWISETEGLGKGRFGTLEDEIAAYKKWGWKGWDKPAKEFRRTGHDADAYVRKEFIHNVSEGDYAEGFLLQYVRSGQRGMFDWGEAWAGYYKTHYAYRTDGFAFSASRKNAGLKVDWYEPKVYEWSDSRAEICHFWGAGLFDYYCLTGDVDALEAGRDMVEHAKVLAAKAFPKVGSPLNTFGIRKFSRTWMAGIRLAQFTRAPEDRKWCDEMFEKAMKASDWHAYGFYYGGPGGLGKWTKPLAPDVIPPRLAAHLKDNGIILHLDGEDKFVTKGTERWNIMFDAGSWEQHSQAYAFEWYYRLTGNQEAKARVIKMAEFARDFQWSKHCQFIQYKTVVDVVEKGKCFDLWSWDDTHNGCPGPGGEHGPSYTLSAVDVFALAYSFSGDLTWLELAKTCYNRGSKRLYNSTKQSAADDEVFRLVGFEGRSTVDTSFMCSRLFYEIPRVK